MEIIEENDNVKRVYEVHYDKEKLKELLDEIIRNASYRTDGKFTAPYNATYEGNEFTFGAVLPNGDPLYENIKRIYRYTSKGQGSYHNDSIAVEGTEVNPPRLAYIIAEILNDDYDSIYEFMDYENNEELIPIDERIVAANKAVDEIDNFNFDEKINAINNLKHLCGNKKDKEYFDVDLLKKYYSQAYSLFELELVSETTKKHNSKILLKDYKQSKKDD